MKKPPGSGRLARGASRHRLPFDVQEYRAIQLWDARRGKRLRTYELYPLFGAYDPVLAPHPTRPGYTLLGHDIRVTDALPPLGTPGDLMLLDLSAYLIGGRQQIDIAASEHPSFLSNQTLWRFTSRLTGQPWPRDKLTLADGTTVSPFVALSA